jgi:hypothetical protein
MATPVKSGKKCKGCKSCDCDLLETMGITCAQLTPNTPYVLAFDEKCNPTLVENTSPAVQNRMTLRLRIIPKRTGAVPNWFLPGDFGATLGNLDGTTPFTFQILDVATQGTTDYYRIPTATDVVFGALEEQLFELNDFHTAANTSYKVSIQALNNPTAYQGNGAPDDAPESTYLVQSLFPVITSRSSNKIQFGLTQTDSPTTTGTSYTLAAMLNSPIVPIVYKTYYGGFTPFFGGELQVLVCGMDTVNSTKTVPTVDYLDFLIVIEN